MMYTSLILMGLSLVFICSCDSGSMSTSADDDTSIRDNYLLLVEAHALKQEILFDIVKALSNDYQSRFLSEELTADQISAIANALDSAAEFASEHEQDLKFAQTIFENANHNKDIKGAVVDFWGWISGSAKRSRMRVLTIASNLSENERSNLYNNWLRDNYKQETKDEEDFWKKLEEGYFDNKANRIFDDFNKNDDFIIKAQEKDLTIQNVFVKEGTEGVNKGAVVLIESVKEATPLGEGMGYVEKAAEFIDYSENKEISPIRSDGKIEELKNILKDKLTEYVPIDEIFDNSEMAKNFSESLLDIYNSAKGPHNAKKWIRENLEWGGILINEGMNSKYKCDIVIAKNIDANSGSRIKVLIGVFNRSGGEGIEMVIPVGNWEVEVIDMLGNFEKEIAKISPGTMEVISIFGASDPDDGDEDEEEYAWVLKEVIDHDGKEAIESFNNTHKGVYEVEATYARNDFTIKRTYIGKTNNSYDPPAVHGESMAFKGTFSQPPEVLAAGENVEITVSLSVIEDNRSFFTFDASVRAQMGNSKKGFRSFENEDGDKFFRTYSKNNYRSFDETVITTASYGSEGDELEIRFYLSSSIKIETWYVYEYQKIE
jgi:hypothetical protein